MPKKPCPADGELHVWRRDLTLTPPGEAVRLPCVPPDISTSLRTAAFSAASRVFQFRSVARSLVGFSSICNA